MNGLHDVCCVFLLLFKFGTIALGPWVSDGPE